MGLTILMPWVLLLGCLPAVLSDCCPSSADTCPLASQSVPVWSRLSGLVQCCSYGTCNAFCCECDAECRVIGCQYFLENTTFSQVTEPEVAVSQSIKCDSSATEPCDMSFTIEHVFQKGETRAVKLAVPVVHQIEADFESSDYGSSVAAKTGTGMAFRCTVPPGHEGHLAQTPQFVVLSGESYYKCCDPQDPNKCEITKRKLFSYRKPLVDHQGRNAGEWFCRSSPVKTEEEQEAWFQKPFTWCSALFLLLIVFVLCLIRSRRS